MQHYRQKCFVMLITKKKEDVYDIVVAIAVVAVR